MIDRALPVRRTRALDGTLRPLFEKRGPHANSDNRPGYFFEFICSARAAGGFRFINPIEQPLNNRVPSIPVRQSSFSSHHDGPFCQLRRALVCIRKVKQGLTAERCRAGRRHGAGTGKLGGIAIDGSRCGQDICPRMPIPRDPTYAGYRHPAELISYVVWLYFLFPLSLRMVEEMLAARGIRSSTVEL